MTQPERILSDEEQQAMTPQPTPQTEGLVERVARAMAADLGDEYDHAFISKPEWIRERGHKGGRYRDINEPFRAHYDEAARAAIAITVEACAEVADRVEAAILDLAAETGTVTDARAAAHMAAESIAQAIRALAKGDAA